MPGEGEEGFTAEFQAGFPVSLDKGSKKKYNVIK
jgi:hypothetical protein